MSKALSGFPQILFAIVLTISALLAPSYADANGGRPEAGLTGNWHTRWTIMEYGAFKTYEFDMYIVQSGSQITGSSSYYNWSISGTLSGSKITGTWAAMLPQGAPHTSGQFDFTVSSSGSSISGIFKGEYHHIWDSRFTVVATRTGSGSTIPSDDTTPTPSPAPSNDTQPSSSPKIGECDFNGTWDTDYGELHLTQSGTSLTGTYNYQDGRITGTVNGNTATGTWSESPTHQPPLDAGDFIFTIEPGCSAFKGQWRYGTCDWDGDINGTRVSQPSSSTSASAGPWAGKWETRWGTMELTQNSNQVAGNYSHDSGKISGTISGNIFTGWWSEAPSYNTPNDAGAVELTISSDGKTMTGRWKYGTSGSWYENDWSGDKIESPVIPLFGIDWNGTWNTDWGTMELTQADSSVKGTYTYSNGRIEGIAMGNTFTGKWAKAPSYSPPKEAGELELTRSKNGNAFIGRWKYADCSWSGTWNGVLTGADINPSPSPSANHKPVASFTLIPQMPTVGDTLVAASQSSDPDGDALTYSWYFDGQLQNQYANRQYLIYTNVPAGVHNVTLQVSDNKGGNASQQYQVNVYQPPSPQPSPSQNQAPTVSLFISPQSPTTADTLVATGQAFDKDGDTLTYIWYKDGARVNEYDNRTYMLWPNPQAGTHTVNLQISDGKGGVTPAQQTVSVAQPVTPSPAPGGNNPPRAYFTIDPPQPQSGNDIYIIDQSTDPDNDNLTLTWSVDGQQMSQYTNQKKWKWTNPSAGGHVIQLTVNDVKGGTDSFARRVRLPGDAVPTPDDDTDDDSKDKWKIGPFSCFIATAAYGSESATQLDTLRAFRDSVLLKSEAGKWLVDTYYHVSPPLAQYIATHEEIRVFIRECLLDPIICILENSREYWNN